MSPLRAGVARANITPPVGMLMSGYGLRKTPAVGVHDELHAVALYLTDGPTEAGLVTADLLYIDAEGTQRVRQACCDRCGLPQESILVACSHTHGGPQTNLLRVDFPRSSLLPADSGDGLKEAYTTVLVHTMAGALSEAKRNAALVRVGYGRQDCSFAMNRRERRSDDAVVIGQNPTGPTAPFTDVIRLDRIDTREPLALVLSYACHGTTLTDENLLYTADYPGRAKRLVEQQFPTARALFIAGCSGDINPHPRGEFCHCVRHGRRLGCAAVQAALDIEEMVQDADLTVARHRFQLPLEEPPSLGEAKERLKQAKAGRFAGGRGLENVEVLNWATARAVERAEALVEALERGETDLAIPVETQALAIGDCAIVGMPGEIFVRIGQKVAERSPFARTMPISHANGAIGYVPTADQVPLGGYEVERARASRHGLFIAPQADQAMIDGALAALRTCFHALHG